MAYLSSVPRRSAASIRGSDWFSSGNAAAETADPKHVMIVDDDSHFRSLLAVMLKQTGMGVGEVWEAADSSSAFAICQTKRVDAAFCDLNLSTFRSKDGIEIVRQLRASLPRIPIFIVTAESSTSLIQRVCAAGATGHILKPINLRILRKVLSTSLSGSSLPAASAMNA